MALVPKFSAKDVTKILEAQVRKIEDAIVTRLQRIGEKFITVARNQTKEQGGFGDVTGNLRSSIGYVILKNGRQLFSSFPGAKTEGRSKGAGVASDAAKQYNKGYAIICVAGMEYAALVEAKGRDVITGSSIQAENDLKISIAELASKFR